MYIKPMEREIKPFHVSKWCALQSACIEMNHHYQRIVNGNALKEDTRGVMGVGDDAPHILNIIRSSVNTLKDTFAVDSSKKLPVPLMPGLGMTPALTLPPWLCRLMCNGKVHKHNSWQNNGACRLISSTSVTAIVDPFERFQEVTSSPYNHLPSL